MNTDVEYSYGIVMFFTKKHQQLLAQKKKVKITILSNMFALQH